MAFLKNQDFIRVINTLHTDVMQAYKFYAHKPSDKGKQDEKIIIENETRDAIEKFHQAFDQLENGTLQKTLEYLDDFFKIAGVLREKLDAEKYLWANPYLSYELLMLITHFSEKVLAIQKVRKLIDYDVPSRYFWAKSLIRNRLSKNIKQAVKLMEHQSKEVELKHSQEAVLPHDSEDEGLLKYLFESLEHGSNIKSTLIKLIKDDLIRHTVGLESEVVPVTRDKLTWLTRLKTQLGNVKNIPGLDGLISNSQSSLAKTLASCMDDWDRALRRRRVVEAIHQTELLNQNYSGDRLRFFMARDQMQLKSRHQYQPSFNKIEVALIKIIDLYSKQLLKSETMIEQMRDIHQLEKRFRLLESNQFSKITLKKVEALFLKKDTVLASISANLFGTERIIHDAEQALCPVGIATLNDKTFEQIDYTKWVLLKNSLSRYLKIDEQLVSLLKPEEIHRHKIKLLDYGVLHKNIDLTLVHYQNLVYENITNTLQQYLSARHSYYLWQDCVELGLEIVSLGLYHSERTVRKQYVKNLTQSLQTFFHQGNAEGLLEQLETGKRFKPGQHGDFLSLAEITYKIDDKLLALKVY